MGFHQDDGGTWVAELDCEHTQHVRHSPPFRSAPWVLDDTERDARIGTDLECPLCDRAELPAGLQVVHSTEVWDHKSMPASLRRTHRLAAGVWGRLQVQEGRLRFRARTDPPLEVVVTPQRPQVIPPEVHHEVEPQGPVRFFLEFLRR